MTERVLGRRIVRRQTVTSTMDEAAALAAAGEPEGTVVVAEFQTDGRGRAGRSWVAPPGTALLFSVVLRPAVPPASLGVLGLLAGVAVAEGIEATTGLGCRLKWPNDIWLAGKKVAGILTVSRFAEEHRPLVVLGVGINVNLPAPHVPDGGTSLLAETGETFDRTRVLDRVLVCLDDAYARFRAGNGMVDLSGWRSRAAMVGETVSVVGTGRTLTGVLRDVADDGALLLESTAGETFRIHSGELVRGPRLAEPTVASEGVIETGDRRQAVPNERSAPVKEP